VIPNKIKQQILQKSQKDGVVGFNKGRGYHLEFALENLSEARELCEEFATSDIFAHICDSPTPPLRVVIKDSESICNLLALVGASKSALELHDKIAMRQVRNLSNRRANCDAANIGRQIETARAQVETFSALVKSPQFNGLPAELKSLVTARLENPEATYDELAEILQISKSGLVHRIKKIYSL
jgi:DNA-binding protein WhiA